jgi:hypothetical protein
MNAFKRTPELEESRPRRLADYRGPDDDRGPDRTRVHSLREYVAAPDAPDDDHTIVLDAADYFGAAPDDEWPER